MTRLVLASVAITVALACVEAPQASAQSTRRLHLVETQLRLDAAPLLLASHQVPYEIAAPRSTVRPECPAADALERRGRRLRRAGRATAVVSSLFVAAGLVLVLQQRAHSSGPDALPFGLYGGIGAGVAAVPLFFVGSPLLGVGNARMRQAARLRRSGC